MNIPKTINRESIAKCRVLVVGDVMIDKYWYGNVNRISAEAPVPIVHIKRNESRLGGAANVAANVKALGARATLLSVIGQDKAARDIKQLLEACEIKAFLAEDPDMETVVKLRVVSQGQQMLRIDFEKQPNHEVMAVLVERFESLVKEHDVVVFSDYGKGGLEHISKMIHFANKERKSIFIDPKGGNWTRYCGATLITPNLAELYNVVGTCFDDAQIEYEVNELIKKLDLKALLLTRSKDGMTRFESGKSYSIPEDAREIADVTGAGDTVIATLAVMAACHLDLSQSMIIANKAAGLVVAKFGTASVNYEELFGDS